VIGNKTLTAPDSHSSALDRDQWSALGPNNDSVRTSQRTQRDSIVENNLLILYW